MTAPPPESPEAGERGRRWPWNTGADRGIIAVVASIILAILVLVGVIFGVIEANAGSELSSQRSNLSSTAGSTGSSTGATPRAAATSVATPQPTPDASAPATAPTPSAAAAPSAAPDSGTGTGTDASTNQTPAVPGDTTAATLPSRRYPLHTGIISTTFWVGEIFDPNAADGSQMYSTYDSKWFRDYGGCDGSTAGGECATGTRTAANGYYPTTMTPKENPFYLDVPFDDVNDPAALATRQSVVPWAHDPAYAGYGANSHLSLMKNRWVLISANGHTCYGQIEDAGPGQYHDSAYVFGGNDARPVNKKFNGAGLDVSPALNGCLHYSELDGEDDVVSWRFVEAAAVPAGPWRTLITTSGVH